MKKSKLPTSKSLFTLSDHKNLDTLYRKASHYIDQARQNIQRTVDTEIVKAYWSVGCDIVKEEQKGKKRAE